MLKFILITSFLVSFSFCKCIIKGGINNGSLTPEVTQISDWTISKMSKIIGIGGEYTILKISNIQTQITNGINYYLMIRLINIVCLILQHFLIFCFKYTLVIQ